MNSLTKITTHLPYSVECRHQRREERHGLWIKKKSPPPSCNFYIVLYIYIYIYTHILLVLLEKNYVFTLNHRIDITKINKKKKKKKMLE